MSEVQEKYLVSDKNYEFKFEKQVLDYAKANHDQIGQKRKYTGDPYWYHLIEVVEILKANTESLQDYQVYAAYLHDIIEDTDITVEDLQGYLKHIGMSKDLMTLTIDHVLGLTDVSKSEDGNRAYRKLLDLRHLGSQINTVKSIKLADIISNTRSIVAHDKKFSMTYIPEKIALLNVLFDSDFNLYLLACYEVQKARMELGI